MDLAHIEEFCERVLDPAVYTDAAPLDVRVWQCAERLPYAELRRRNELEFEPVQPGWRWGPKWSTAWFVVRGKVPVTMRGKRVVLRFSSGTEALLWLGGVPRQGFDANRDAADLFDPAKGGEEVDVLIEAACNHPLGVGSFFWDKPEVEARWSEEKPGRLERCELAVFHEDDWQLRRTLGFARQLVEELEKAGGDAVRARVLGEAIERAMSVVRPGEVAATAAAAMKVLAEALSGTGSPSRTRCLAVGHAHLDTAWMWPIAETKRKCLRTFSNSLRLMERIPEYMFLCSQAQQYEWVRESSPALFEQIARRVRDGRWEAMGAMWIEPDGNLPSGESFVRQILHGTRWWNEAFGESALGLGKHRLAFLPDTFGFAASLPQIFRLAGMDTFITNKLWWNETNEFPHIHFRWRGIDGTEIVSHLTPGQEYNATNTPFELRRGQTIAERKDELGVGNWLQPFGFGDGGGGPTDWNILNAQLAEKCEGVANTRLGGASAFCDILHRRRGELMAAGRDLPVHDGELYLERHRGTYTTQAAVKKANARAEAELRVAEWLWSGGPVEMTEAERTEVGGKLDEAWKLTLLNQFHDILPGSSIGEVYADAARDYAKVHEICGELIARGKKRWMEAAETTGMSKPAMVFNPGSAARSQWVEWSESGGGRQRAFVRDVPALGVRVIERYESHLPPPHPGPPPEEERVRLPALVRDDVIQNGIIEARIDECGRVASLRRVGGLDVCARGEVSSGRDGRTTTGESLLPLNQLMLHDDHPRYWEAWDIDAEAMEKGRPVEGEAESWRVEEDGSGPAAIRVERALGKASRIVQTFSLVPGSPRLDVETWVDWHESRTMLRVLFPVDVQADFATYEIPFGHIERSTRRETNEEKSRFEVSAHRWMDLSEPGRQRGVALLNDCKYGHSCHRNVMGLTLLRSPKWPDPNADMGEHTFTYSLMPHDGDWRAAGVDRESELMVRPMWTVPLPAGQSGTLRGEWAPLVISCEGGAAVRVAAVKGAEDGERIVIRIVESNGRAGVCRIEWKLPVRHVLTVDLLESRREHAGFVHVGGRSEFPIGAFQIVTLQVQC